MKKRSKEGGRKEENEEGTGRERRRLDFDMGYIFLVLLLLP